MKNRERTTVRLEVHFKSRSSRAEMQKAMNPGSKKTLPPKTLPLPTDPGPGHPPIPLPVGKNKDLSSV